MTGRRGSALASLDPGARRVFAGAYGGWLLDGYNSGIFGLVLTPSLTELLPRSGYGTGPTTLAFFGELVAAGFLFGWGLSLAWGPVADKLGRVRALRASILIYSVFTFMGGLSWDVWSLLAFRFLAAVGIGAEWSMAGTLVAETVPEQHRVTLGGVLHSGYYWGFLASAVVNALLADVLGWRWMFFLGGLPVLLVLYIRSRIGDDRAERADRVGTATLTSLVRTVLSPPLRRRTLVSTLLVVVALMGFWAGSQYLTTALRTVAVAGGTDPATAGRLGAAGAAVVAALTAATCLLVPRACRRLGRRGTLGVAFGLTALGTALAYGVALPLASPVLFLVALVPLGVGGASFAVFTIWLPELYPGSVRATGFAFCSTVSRFAAGGLTFLVGAAVTATGSVSLPLLLTSVPLLLGLLLLPAATETGRTGLPV